MGTGPAAWRLTAGQNVTASTAGYRLILDGGGG